jgi:hypothetical protein
MTEKKKNVIAVIAVTVALYIHGTSIVNNHHYLQYLWSDQEGYYMYLPAVFIHKTFVNIPVRTTFEYKPYKDTQKILTRFTYGIALLELPFWLLAYLSRFIQGLPLDDPFANDFSVAILLAGCFYTALGLFYLKKVLTNYKFNNYIVWLTLIIVLLGTNLFYYCTRQPGMSHHYSFCLVSILLYYMISFFSKPLNLNKAVKFGLIAGLLVLIRPTNLLMLAILFFIGIEKKEDIIKRLNWLKANSKNFLILTLVAATVWIPQFVYWYYISGSIIFYSYTEAGFLYFKNPYFWQIFFHPCNGFFIYTPIMLLSFVAIFYFAWKKLFNARATLFFFLIFSYLCASWGCWWFGGAFGYRSFIEYYAIFAIPLAAFLQKLFASQFISLKIITSLFIALCCMINFRMTTYYYLFQVEPDGKNAEQLIDALKCCFFLC